MHRRILLLTCCLLFSQTVGAQNIFTDNFARNRAALKAWYKRHIQRQVVSAQSSDKVHWVRLVETEEEKIKQSSRYGAKTLSFKQLPPPRQEGFSFSKRANLVQRKINENGILKGYNLIVPDPKDLLSVYEWEVNSLGVFFAQGIKHGQVHGDFVPKAKKYQDGVVELRFQPKTSIHTFIILVSCRNRTIYLFLDNYKNRL